MILSSIQSRNIVAESPGVCASTVMVSGKIGSSASRGPHRLEPATNSAAVSSRRIRPLRTLAKVHPILVLRLLRESKLETDELNARWRSRMVDRHRASADVAAYRAPFPRRPGGPKAVGARGAALADQTQTITAPNSSSGIIKA